MPVQMVHAFLPEDDAFAQQFPGGANDKMQIMDNNRGFIEIQFTYLFELI